MPMSGFGNSSWASGDDCIYRVSHSSETKHKLSNQLSCYSGDTKTGALHVMLEMSVFIQCQHAGVRAFLLSLKCYRRACPQTYNITYEF